MKGKMRVIAFAMAVMMVFTTIVNDTTLLTVNASDLVQATVENYVDSDSDVVAGDETTGTDDMNAEDNSAGDNTETKGEAIITEDGTLEDTDLEDTDEDVTEDDSLLTAGLDAAVVEEEPVADTEVFEQSVDMGDMIVHIYAEAGVLPNDVSVAVTALSGTQATTAQETVEGLLSEEVEVVDTYSYDITFSTPEGEVQPAGYVEVTFEEVAKAADAEVSVFHMDEDLLGATQVSAEVAAPEATVTDVAINASSFSVYTVTITNATKNRNVTFDMQPGQTKLLKDIITTYFANDAYKISYLTVDSGQDVIRFDGYYNDGLSTRLTALKEGNSSLSFYFKETQVDSYRIMVINIKVATGYNVSFNTMGATGTTPTALLIPSKTTISTKLGTSAASTLFSGAGLTKTGYVFGGWYTSNTFASNTLFTADTVVTKDTVLYANWVKGYTVSFYLDGGTGGPATQTVIANGKVASSVLSQQPVLSGATFAGWKYFSPTNGGTGINDGSLVAFDQNTAITMDTIVYATWTVTSSDTAAAIPNNASSPDAGKVTATKAAEWTSLDNGIAKLTFDVSGVPFATGSDIVIVMDASLSMYQQVNSYYESGTTNVDRMAPAKAATVALVNKLLENGNASNNRVAFVPFADSIQPGYLNFQTDAAKLTSNVLATSASSGTDYEEALKKAKTYITGRGTTNRPAYVIFMSDGIDNRSGTKSKTVADELNNLNVTIFPIGIQLPESEASTIKLLAVNKPYVNVTQLTDLTTILSGITEEIKVAGTEAVIKDAISDKFSFYNAAGYEPTTGVTCTNGKDVTISIGDITSTNKQFSFYIQVKPGVNVTGNVKTNASAELTYKNADAVTQTITDTTNPGIQKPEIPLVNGTVTVTYYRVDEAGKYVDASGNGTTKEKALIKTVVQNNVAIANGGTNYEVNADFTIAELAEYEIYSGDTATKSVSLLRSAPTGAVAFNVEYATKYDLKVKADTASKEYDGTQLKKTTYTITGLQAGHYVSSSNISVAGTITNVGSVDNVATVNAIVIKNGAGTDVTKRYNIVTEKGKLTVTPKAVTVSAIANSKIYGGTEPTLTGKVTGMVGSEKLTVVYSRATGENVGNYTITPMVTPNNNYTIKTETANFEITPKAATLSVENKTKVYGSSDPKFTVKASGLVGSDTITGIKYTRTSGENVGSYTVNATYTANSNYTITVVAGKLDITPKSATLLVDSKSKVYGSDDPVYTSSVSGLVSGDSITGIKYTRVTGENIGSYTITATYTKNSNYDVTVTNGKLNITAKEVILTVDNKTKVYGSDDPDFTSSVSGLVGSDKLNGVRYTRQNGSNVGDYTINATYGSNPNYTITVIPGKLSITRKAVTLTVENKTKVYGSADPDFTSSVSGLVGSDKLNGVNYTRQTGSNVGDYTINATYGSNPNYAITVIPGTLSITKKAVTLTVHNKTKVYGSADPDFTSSVSGLVGSDKLNGVSYTRQTGSNVGDYSINATYGSNPNYTITVIPGTLTITKKAVTLKVENKTKVYGDIDPSFSSVATGLVGSDVLTGINYTRQTGNNVGDYTINATYGSNPNYTITVQPGILTITKKAATLTVGNKTKVYGDVDPTFTSTTTGMVGSDVLTGISYTRAAGSNVGEYKIDATFTANSNYDITVIAGKLTITKRAATITATAGSKTYGDVDPALTGKVTNVVAGDDLNVTYARESGNTVGSYTITPSYTKNDNYDVTVVTAEFEITPKTVTYTVDPATKKFFEEDPDFTGSFAEGSLVYGDEIVPKFTRETGEDVGEYAIFATLSNPNYVIKVTNGVLTITKAAPYATIDAEGFNKTYDGISQMLEEATASDDRETVYDISYLVDGVVYEGEGLPEFKNVKFDEDGNVVPYVVTVVASNSNYEDATLDVEVLIGQRPITITALTISKLFSGDALSADYASITAGTLSAKQILKSVKVTGKITAVGSGSNVPSNAIIVDSENEDVTANYAIRYVNGLLTLYAQLPVTPEVPVLIEEPLTPLAPVVPVIVQKVTPVRPTVAEVEEEEATVIEEEETPLAPAIEAEEIVPEEILDEEVPLAVLSHGDCWIHWLILALSLIYAVYAVVRAMQRDKQIKKLTDGAYDKNASTQA